MLRIWSLLCAATAAAAQTVNVCVAGQCLEGTSNITRLGAILDSGSSTFILLPGQYTSTVQPTSLLQALSSASSTVSLVTGFSNSSSPVPLTLPLNVALLPGLLSYPSDLYAGDPVFHPLPSAAINRTSITRGSIILSPNTYAAIEANNGGTRSRTVIWDTVPYLSQLPPSMAGTLELVSIQSATCTPSCSSAAFCSLAGTCVCPTGFTGASCETCETGFFGPNCQPCPADCGECSDGITGSGVCLSLPVPSNAPSNCNCANGVCNASGTCTCSQGWTTGTGGAACSQCLDGFFLTSSGNCEICRAGCTNCNDNTGVCTRCESGLVIDANDRTRCIDSQANQCEPGSFMDGTECATCNSACNDCNGPSAGDCTECASGTFFLNGDCVSTQSNLLGVCNGSSLVANRPKGVCDTCPLRCTACQYTSFNVGTKFEDVRCTRCLPGFVLSEGRCSESCPAGTFVGADGFTCTACASSCGTCVDRADFCLTCKNNQLASGGTCVSTCPTNTFSSNNACLPCHGDCATCSGAGFNQCSSCSSSLPVLTSSGRCVATCSRTEYFDASSGSCKACDSSCSSCSASGSNGCLACSNPKQVLRAGACVNVDCGDGQGTSAGLGVCLAEMVIVPNGELPPVVIPPIDPDVQNGSQSGKKLEWWQILLMVLGVLFIIAVIVLIWRRHARKKRAQQTENFKHNLKARGLWAKLWRNPFSSWFNRRSTAVREADIERLGAPSSSKLGSVDRRTALGVPRSLSRGSWVTMTQHTQRRPSIDGKSYVTADPGAAGIGANRGQRYIDEEDFFRDHPPAESYRSRSPDPRKYGPAPSFGGSSRRYDNDRRGESRYYGQEIEQSDDGRTERTYDPHQYPRPDSLLSSSQTGSSRYTEGDRYDDSRYNHQRSRSHGYSRDHDRGYPSSRSHRTRRDDRSYGDHLSASIQRSDSPSIYSTVTGNPRHLPDTREPAREVLTSRFSMSTTAASLYNNPKRKPVPEPVPEMKEPPRQLTDAEMYKMSKLFPDLLNLVSPTKKSSPKPPVIQDRNPFRLNSF